MSGIAQETATLYEKLASTVGTQLDGVSQRFDGAVSTVSDTWTRALARHEQVSSTLNQDLQVSLAAQSQAFAQHSEALLATVDRTHVALQTETATTLTTLVGETRGLHEGLMQKVENQLEGLAGRLDQTAARVSEQWAAAQRHHEQSSASMARETQAALAATVQHFEQASTRLLASLDTSHSAQRETLAQQDQRRLDSLSFTVQSMATALQQAWHEAGEQAQTRQQLLFNALEESARQIGAGTAAQATRTIDEVAYLMQTAAEAPKLAAEVIAQLRQELSASMARDNTLLEERSRLMATLGALLDAINHASTEQRSAIDALVATSAELLDRASTRFEERIGAESERMTGVAAQIACGAVEVSSLSEAFGCAVQLFSESNDKLMEMLQRIEGALSASMARSDDQLAYYVAQAREVIDLSIMSQKKVVEDLQGLAGKSAAVTGGA